MAPNAHSISGPSSLHRIEACPPSARLNEKLNGIFGNTSSVFAEEGTKAHALAEAKLRKELGEYNKFAYEQMVAQLGPIDNEMEYMTDRYVDIVLEKYYAAKKSCPDAKLLIEVKLSMESKLKGCWGTSDVVIVSDDVLIVIDLKYGKGVPVSAEGNPQARAYALGALLEFGELYGFDKIQTVIAQVRLDSVSEETLNRAALLEWADEIAPKVEQAYAGTGEFQPGEHCRFCAARAICFARAAEAMSVFKHGFDAPGVIPDSEIPGILKVLDTAEAWIKDIRAYAQNQALRGVEWKGWKLVRGRRPGRKWKNEQAVIDVLARAGYSPDQYMKSELRSCSDMEKVLGKQAFAAFLGEAWTQGEGAPTLVPESDKRVEYSSADAALSDLTTNVE